MALFIELFKNNLTVIPATLGVAIASLAILSQRKIAREKNALDFETNLESNTDYDDHLDKIRELLADQTTPVSHWAQQEFAGSDEAKAIRYILNYWERGANAIYNDIFSEKYLYDSYASHVITLHERLQEFIIYTQNNRQPSAYKQFLKLAKLWSNKKQLETHPIKRSRNEKVIICLSLLIAAALVVATPILVSHFLTL